MSFIQELVYVSNMYPTEQRPYFGTFVQRSYSELSKLHAKTSVITIGEHKNKYIKYFLFYYLAFRSLTLKGACTAYVHYITHSFIPVFAASILNKKINVILHFHGSDAFPEKDESYFRRVVKKAINKLAIKRAKMIVVPSEFFKKKLELNYKIGCNIVVSASGGVSRELYNNDDLKSERKNQLIFAGRLIAGKGGVTAVQAMLNILCVYNEWSGCIIGEGPELDLIKYEIEQAKNNNDKVDVSITGLLPPTALAYNFKESKILLFPSTREGESLGLIIVEAIYCGVIPLVINNGAVMEIIEPSLHAILVAKDKCEFFHKLESLILLSDRERREISDKLISYATYKYDSHIVAGRLIDSILRIEAIN